MGATVACAWKRPVRKIFVDRQRLRKLGKYVDKIPFTGRGRRTGYTSGVSDDDRHDARPSAGGVVVPGQASFPKGMNRFLDRITSAHQEVVQMGSG